MTAIRYDTQKEPAAPVALVRLESVSGELTVAVAGIVDTGADCTLVPEALTRDLKLPQVGRVQLRGVDGKAFEAREVAVRVDFGAPSRLCRVVAFGDELILGRDLLNAGSLQLNGPQRRGDFRAAGRRR